MISVIVPIYNVEKYLSQCLDSIICQTYSDLEIILVDDGSTDSCGSICDAYALQDSRIKVIHKKNGGLVSARKDGICAAQGEYIGYVDGDDWIEPHMYERMYQSMMEYNTDVVMCGHFENTGNILKEVYHSLEEGRYGKEQLIENIYPRMIVGDNFFEWNIFPGLWDKLFTKKSIIQHQMAVDERITIGEDVACVYPVLLNADSIYIIHECLYNYRQTTSSMVKKIQNYENEREQFRILYTSVNKNFEKYKDIFDLREQWVKYMLFLMLPRTDSLYKECNKLDYLFPFTDVSKGSDIVLYGAGTYGQRLYTYLNKTRFCNVVLWVDRNYIELRKMGLEVNAPSDLEESNCSIVVLANTFAKSRKGLYKELIEKYPDKKICMIDENLIFSEQTKTAYGLNS